MPRVVIGNVDEAGFVWLLAAPIARALARRETKKRVAQPESYQGYDPVVEEAQAMGLDFQGYDELGAILIDSDGKRVEI